MRKASKFIFEQNSSNLDTSQPFRSEDLQDRRLAVRQFIYSQDPVTFWSLTTSLIMALLITALVTFNSFRLPSKLPLFYSLPWGENQLASLSQFIILPAIIFLVVLVNLITSWHLHSSQLILKRMLAVSTTLVATLLLITVIKIIYTFI